MTLEMQSAQVRRRLFGACLTIELLLLLADALINWGRLIDIGPIRRLFNIAREDGLASWFMASQTLLAGLTLWLVVLVVRARGESRGRVWGWAFLALFFTGMAVDDGALIHERVGSAFKAVVLPGEGDQAALTWGGRLLEIFPSYPWQLLFLPLLAAAGLFLLVFLWRQLSRKGARSALLLALGCLALAVGLDFVEGMSEAHPWNLHAWMTEQGGFSPAAVRHFSKAIEEFLEMLGISVFWALFADQLMRLARGGLLLIFRHGSQG
ncbi:hypothetical protein DESUT3_26320 [Desulfuromonas versatilis]|uniref:Sulfatase n=1 Tax=Desulfuromonas versatilis TaxID=2802975 RepID=A0ABN6DZN8_9BACT|nr:hypothetical protein DESUT3_26320 [Desulfuromonas versatilis]